MVWTSSRCVVAAFILGFAILSPGVAGGQETRSPSKTVIDRLHGFMMDLPEGYEVKVIGRAVCIFDPQTHAYLLMRVARHDGNLRAIARSWWMERKLLLQGAPTARFAFRPISAGILILGSGLPYPFLFNPMMAVNFGLLGLQPPGPYEEATLIVPGEAAALVITILSPAHSQGRTLDPLLAIARSFRLIPDDERIAWRPEVIDDPMLGLAAGTVHVPEGFAYAGTAIRQGTVSRPIFSISRDPLLFRLDRLNVQSMALQTPFGANAQTLFTWNGQSWQEPGMIALQSVDDIVQLILNLWQAETGQDWQLEAVTSLPLTPLEQKLWHERTQLDAQLAMAFGGAVASERIKFVLKARSGNLRREAMADGSVLLSEKADYIAINQDTALQLSLQTMQFPEEQREEAHGIFSGILFSLSLNPQHALRALEESARLNRELNRMVLGMLREQQEFNTRMATAWSNALSDHTYVRDLETQEILRVNRKVWESGEFWRDPIWQDIFGGIERGSALESLLAQEGWRRLEQSLEGFPEQWR